MNTHEKGYWLEREVAEALQALGYHVLITPKSSDFGADIIAEKDGKRIAIQVKNLNGKVGVHAIQEVLGGKEYYGCDEAWVVSKSGFTKKAQEMARKTRVQLILADELIHRAKRLNDEKRREVLVQIAKEERRRAKMKKAPLVVIALYGWILLLMISIVMSPVVVIAITIYPVFLWLGAKFAKIEDASFGKAFIATLGGLIVSVIIGAIVPVVGGLLGLIAFLWIVKTVFNTDWGKAVIAWLFAIVIAIILMIIIMIVVGLSFMAVL